MGFNCTGCGVCCGRIKSISEMVVGNSDLRFPHTIDENGRCEMLDDNNRCKIYDERPLICNIDKLADYLKINKNDFYQMNAIACNKMILEEGLDLKYLVK